MGEGGPPCPQGAHPVLCEASSRVTDVLVCLEQPQCMPLTPAYILIVTSLIQGFLNLKVNGHPANISRRYYR